MPNAPRTLLVNPTIASRRSARFPLALLTLAAALERNGAGGSRIVDGNVDRGPGSGMPPSDPVEGTCVNERLVSSNIDDVAGSVRRKYSAQLLEKCPICAVVDKAWRIEHGHLTGDITEQA